jgi:hypothetical protein
MINANWEKITAISELNSLNGSIAARDEEINKLVARVVELEYEQVEKPKNSQLTQKESHPMRHHLDI